MLTNSSLFEFFKSANLPLDKKQAEQFCIYANMLVEKNKVMNLTAITDDEGIAIKHFVDSVLPLTLTEFSENASVIDIGAGAGFPSVPMSVYRSDLCFTMLDATNKRVEFLKEACDALDLNAECIHARAEEFKDGKESFDYATARAVARLNVLCEYCLPFVKVGGKFVALKGKDGIEEVKLAENAIKILGGRLEKVIDYKLPTGDERTLVVIQKVKPTPLKYPRPSAKIAKKEL